MKKFFVLLLVIGMGLTMYHKEKQKYENQSETYTIPYMIMASDEFMARARKMSQHVRKTHDGKISITLNRSQKKAWEKSMASEINGTSYLITRGHKRNHVSVSQNYDRLKIRTVSSCLSDLTVYCPRLVSACEMMQVFNHQDGQVDLWVTNVNNQKKVHCHYPGHSLNVSELM